MPRFFEPVHRATANLLRRAGLRLVRTPKAGCCGALHAHSGLLDDARRMARRNIDAFDGARFIVTESAGCGAMMRGYGDLLADDPRYADKARAFSEKVRDISEMLVEAAFRPGPTAFRARVAYDAPCHLHHAQGVTAAPLDLLGAVPGVTLAPLAFSDRCCGGAGLYNLHQGSLSWDVLREKLDAIGESGADVVATGNPGCLMQIGAGLRLAGLPARALHPVEILEASWKTR
jgi:glycolate oxidase iron-sulfur subunit